MRGDNESTASFPVLQTRTLAERKTRAVPIPRLSHKELGWHRTSRDLLSYGSKCRKYQGCDTAWGRSYIVICRPFILWRGLLRTEKVSPVFGTWDAPEESARVDKWWWHCTAGRWDRVSQGMPPEQDVEVSPIPEVESTETYGQQDWPNSAKAPCEGVGPVWLGGPTRRAEPWVVFLHHFTME